MQWRLAIYCPKCRGSLDCDVPGFIASAGRDGGLLSIQLSAQYFPSESFIAPVGLGTSNTSDNRVPIILLCEAIT